MTMTVVLDDNDIQKIKEKERLLDSMITANKELVQLNGENVELIRKIKSAMSAKCDGNQFVYFSAEELLNAIGIDESEWPEWVGEWRKKDA